MHTTDANTDCLNCFTSVLMVIVQKQLQFTSFSGVYFHGCTCQPFRDVITTNGDTMAARYDLTIARLEQIIRAVYQLKVQRECAFDDAGVARPELLAHPTGCNSPLLPARLCTVIEPKPCVYTIRPGRRDYSVCRSYEPPPPCL
jgi:hypothetical protein